jgi:phosphomannomutase
LATEISNDWLKKLSDQFVTGNMQALTELLPEIADVMSFDQTDGLRLILTDQNIVHFRPSGNAPELRCYTESSSVDEAQSLNAYCLQQLTKQLVH